MKTQTGSEFALKKRIGLIGGSSPAVRHLQIAETMGQLIAENGFLLVNGGLKGVMEASARGAKAHGGWVIGILPGKSTQETNRFTDIAIPTGLGYLRNALAVLNSDVLVAINGAYGTLSEIAYTQVYGKKVFGIETWDIPGVIAVESPQAAMQQIIAYFEQPK
ncbi:MAG: TIGR00725 family protein [Candidatus Aminicenantes bacterium]|nr:TIGR00725 family protein [Candidatus Aminicenantes bacterium]